MDQNVSIQNKKYTQYIFGYKRRNSLKLHFFFSNLERIDILSVDFVVFLT